MSLSIIQTLALAGFLFVQVFALIIGLVIRYHFKLFAMPDDKRAKNIMLIMSFDTAILFLISLFLLIISLRGEIL